MAKKLEGGGRRSPPPLACLGLTKTRRILEKGGKKERE